MFTGLVEATGEVRSVAPVPGGLRIQVAAPVARELGQGDSVAVDGVCLTVVGADAETFHADVSPQTARVTTLGAVRAGSVVNLERPLRADARLGGHFVQGHVDGTGLVEELRPEGESFWLTVGFPGALAPFIVPRGSIAVNGISLTVAGVDEGRFHVQVIPYTWRHTNLRHAAAGGPVNLECDILGKYVARALELRRADGAAFAWPPPGGDS
jgi:riboflavin synthase